MGKSETGRYSDRKNVMELEEFVRTALRAIIRGMKDAAEGGCIAEEFSRITFKLSLEAVKDGKIYVTKTEGKASPASNRIEFSTKIARDDSPGEDVGPVEVVLLDETHKPHSVDERSASWAESG